MSILYLAAFAAVALGIMALLVDAVVSVSRRPIWQAQRNGLQSVRTVDRRQQRLPFVGQERRRSQESGQPEQLKRDAA